MKNYQILKSGEVVARGIPRTYIKEGTTHFYPLPPMLAQQGWVQQESPPKAEQIAEVIAACYPPPPVQLSKLTIRRKLRVMEKETAFDAFLDSQPQAKADWTDCSFIQSDDPLFTTYASVVKQTLGLTDEQFATLVTP